MKLVNPVNWLDITIVIILVIAVLRGFTAGFIKSVFGIISIAAGLVAASKYYAAGGTLLLDHVNLEPHLADLVCFLILFLTVSAFVMIIGACLTSITRFKVVRAADKAGGAIAGLAIGTVFTGLFLMVLTAFPLFNNFQEQLDHSTLAPPIVDSTLNLYHQAVNLMPLNLPNLTFYPEQLSGYLSGTQVQPGQELQNIDFSLLDGAGCFVCGNPVKFQGYLANQHGSISPKFQCAGCGRTSDGCQTYEGHHLLYEQCPVVLGNRGYRFDCGIWSNGNYHRPVGICPVCGESN